MLLQSQTVSDFNPRSHKGSDLFSPRRFSKYSRFQSTLPQGERPGLISYGIYLQFISIHAPTRGATDPSPRIRMTHPISIHAPTRGATGPRGRIKKSRNIFQSTLPQGERRRSWRNTRSGRNFNPRSHKGSDRTDTVHQTRS